MKPKLLTIFLMLLFTYSIEALATDYYTASPTATLSGNTGAVNNNWTTNPDGLTGLTTVSIAATDNLIVLNGGVATITVGMSINALTINSGGKIIHNNNATGSSFNINGTLTWNGTIKTLQGVSGSNYFNVKGNVIGTTAIQDAASSRGIYLAGDGLRTINLIQLSSSVTTSSNISVGLLLSSSHSLAGNCKFYSPLVLNADCTLDLAGYDLQASSIKQGSATRLIKGAATSDLTISGSNVSTGTHSTIIYFTPTATVLNGLTIDNAYLTAAVGNVTVGGNLTVNSLNFGTPTGDTGTRILSVGGNFALANNGIMRVQAKGVTTPGTNYDQLSVAGNTTIGSTTTLKVNFTNSYGPSVNDTFYFGTFIGTITGSFGTIQNPSGYTASVTYPTGKIQYQVSSVPQPTPACSYTQNTDLPAMTSNATVEAEIETIYQRFSDSFLGTVEPTTTALDAAIASYDALGISVNGYTITATVDVTNYNQVASFLKTFAQYLKFHPEDTNNIYTKALNTVWLVSDRICKGTMSTDYNEYSYRNFAKPAILIPRIKENAYVKGLFDNLLYKQNQFDYLSDPALTAATTTIGLNVDHIGNSGVVTMAYVKWIDSADERFRYMTAFKRQMEKFASYSKGTFDGIKQDGSGFHHWGAYPSYMYNLGYAVAIVSALQGTSFQISTEGYLRYRDALMAQLMFTNDNAVRLLTMVGRKPHEVGTTISKYDFRNMAVAGGSILGTGASDPVMANLYTRLWGTYSTFGDNTIAPFNEGYFQFNHSMAGIYRKNNWVATCKGFNDSLSGAEIFGPSSGSANRFGRYQSYGAVNVVYPGDALTGNGYDVTTWNWNYNPGTTVIRLPWDKLHAERENRDEIQQKKFAGSISFMNKNSSYLKAVHGTYGMFAMDFQESSGKRWGATYGPETHNTTFTFKKSVFAFDNMLICLGSNIGNNDATNTTMTTLYQRKAIAGGGKEVVNIDNTSQPTTDYSNSYADTSNHWIVDNFSTGFYVFSGSGTIKLTKGNQQTPQHDKLLSEQTIANNPTGNYAIGYIDHGTAPVNKGYEYICMPQATTTDMTNLNSQITAGNKPYTVHRKDNIAHILEYKPTTGNPTFGYAFFTALSGINNTGLLTAADYPCLVMTQYDSIQKNLKIAVNNPDLGYIWRDPANLAVDKQISIKIKGTNWEIPQPNSRVSITGTANGETTIQFTVIDGLPVEIVLSRALTPQTISFNALPAKNIGDPAFNLTATASSGLAVSYTSSNTAVATISGSTVTIVGNGTSTITASQPGNDIYAAATPVEQTLNVNAVLTPLADAYVRGGGYAATNYGTATGLSIKKDGSGDYSREIYLKFNLNNVSSIDNATLRLNISFANTTVTATTWQVYYVPTDSWTETGINWSNKPASSTLLATINGQSSGWAEWNITGQALAELAGDKTLSLHIVSTVINATSDAAFNSKENGNATLRPQLVLTPDSSSTSKISSKNNLTVKSIEPEVKESAIKLYPNPATDYLNISIPQQNEPLNINVLDLNGKIIQEFKNVKDSIYVGNFTAGTYLLQINGTNKTLIFIKK